MNWEDAKYMLAAARERSFAGAGASLRVSHTTVSRRITALETQLATRLFERKPGGLEPTEAGERFLESARAIELGFHNLERTIAGRDTRLGGTLRITAPYLVANHLLMPHFAAFQRRWPHVELQLIAAYASFNLTRREADIAIRLTNHPPENLIGRNLGPMSWSLYGAQDLLRRCQDADEPPPYIGLDDDLGVPAPLRERHADSRLTARVNDHAVLVPAILAGAGVGLLPDFLAQAHPHLVHVAPMPEETVSVWLLTHPDLRQTRRVKLFLDFLQDTLSGGFTPAIMRQHTNGGSS